MQEILLRRKISHQREKRLKVSLVRMAPRDHLRGFIYVKHPSAVGGRGGGRSTCQWPMIPVLRRVQLEDHEFEVSLYLHSKSTIQSGGKKGSKGRYIWLIGEV